MNKFKLFTSLLAVVSVLAIGIDNQSARAAETVTITDIAGRTVEVKRTLPR